MPASSDICASRLLSGQLPDHRSGTSVTARPDEQLAPNKPICSLLFEYIARRAASDPSRVETCGACTISPRLTEVLLSILPEPDCKRANGPHRHSCLVARSAPWRNALNFSHTTVGCTSVRYKACEENPQSAAAMTFSRPTSLAKRTIRSAISSGCSTMLLACVIMPGASTLPSGILMRSNRWYSCSWRGLAASKLYDPALILSTYSMM